MIRRVHHVAAVVQDLEAGYAIWRDALGLPLVRETELADQGIRAALLAAGSCEIELLEPIRPDTGVARFRESRGEGLHHLCFESDDVGRDLKRLAATGVTLIDARPRQGLAGLIGFIHPRSCASVLVELTTPTETAPLPGAPVAATVVYVAVEDVRGAVEMFQNLFGLAPRAAGGDGVVELDGGDVAIQLAALSRTHWRPGLAALGLSTADLPALAERLGRHGVTTSAILGGLVATPAGTRGVPLIVRPRPDVLGEGAAASV